MFKPTPRKPPPATARAPARPPARPPNRAAVLRQKSKEKINKITTVIGVPLSARFSGAEPPSIEAGEIQAVATMVPVIVQGQAMSEPPPNSDNMPRV